MAKRKTFQTDIRRERKKKKIKRALRRLAIVVVVLAAGFGIYFTRQTWIPWFDGILDSTHKITVNDGKLESGNFPIEIGDSANSIQIKKFTDDLFVTVDESYISFYTIDGERTNSIQHSCADPNVKIGDERAIVYESGGTEVTVLNDNETLFTTETDGEIYFAKIAPNNSYAVITSSEGFASYLTVYDKNGEAIYRWANSSRITSVDFKEDGLGCYISAFKMSDGVMSTTVSAVSFDSDEVEMTSEAVSDSSVIRAQKLSDGNIVLVCDDKYVILDKNGKIKSETEYKSDLLYFDSSSEAVAIAVSGISDETKSRLIIIGSDADAMELDVDEKIKSVSEDSSNIYAMGTKTMMLFSSSGSQLATADISSDYVDFVYLNDEILFLGYQEINKIDYAY